ncbi:cytochrome P450 [Nocardia brasiliensis]|uniref:cytochrome P450 n=1 Tax=Nocardia brasiliensis TaxID=37326 RepID=UPI002454EAA2|nr:cytochrome P450 [Nocardia brasiliensis]
MITTTDHEIPLAPGGLPVLGHALALARNPFAFLSSLPAYGDLVRLRLGPQTVIMICAPDLTREMLTDDRTFDKGGPFYDRAREASGDGLVTCPHALHRRQRRLCQPAFRSQHFPAYTAAMVTSARDTAQSWRDGQIVDVNHATLTITMRAMVKAMFATQLSAEKEQEITDDLTVATGGIFRRMLTPPRLNRVPTPNNLRYNRAQARLRQTIADAVSSRRAGRADQGSLLAILLEAKDPENAGGLSALSDNEVAEQVLTFFLAGAETTANLLAWTLYELGRAPDIQEHLHSHTVHVLHGRPASFTLLPELTVADQVATEALRMYPSAWFLTRTVATDAHLGDVPLPAGTTLAYSAYLIQRRPDLYPNPDRFDPDRWEGRKPDRTAYIPFGAGARKCIGDKFAHTQAALSLATMTAMWRFVPLDDQIPRPAVHATLMPRGLRMKVVARQP